MKVGLISIHSAHNYGSVLQAYALQEILKQFSDDVEIINYRPNYFEKLYKIFSIKIYQKYHGILEKFLHFAWRIIELPKRISKYNKFENFMWTHYNLSSQIYRNYTDLQKMSENYDAIVTGSDQIWNTDITEGFDKAFYLAFAPEPTKKISYAASIGRNSLDEKYIEDYAKYINNFDNISVREEDGKSLLKKITNKNITTVLDPTLVIDPKKWETIEQKSQLDLKEKYIFTYILQENKELVEIVNSISEKLNLKVISIAKKKRFKNETIYSDLGPEDFLYLIHHADFIVTNSFHGSVFSIIYEKPCFVVPHSETGNRMVNLYEKLGLENRIIKKASDLKIEKISENPNYAKANKILVEEKRKSLAFLQNALKDSKRKDDNGKK